MNGILTNQFDKTLDIDHQVKILVPDELQIWECDNQKVGNAWSSNKESPFIVVLPPGDHLFKIKVVQPICIGSYSNFQVSATVIEENNLRRELAPLEKIADNYPKTLLTLDEIGAGINHNGIRQMNLLDWLLSIQR
jgi:hypothetical protein